MLLLAGILAAAIMSPLFDRVLAHHFAIACKLVCPVIAGAWIGLIWAGVCFPSSFLYVGLIFCALVRKDDAAGLFILLGVIGICCLTLLPVTLELGVELTRNADTSASILWSSYVVPRLTLLISSTNHNKWHEADSNKLANHFPLIVLQNIPAPSAGIGSISMREELSTNSRNSPRWRGSNADKIKQ